MISETVTPEGDPIVELAIAGQTWTAVIDTGFNGGLELPETLRLNVQSVFLTPSVSLLAGGVQIEEDLYEVIVPFDGQLTRTEATFVAGQQILSGTLLMANYRLEIDFPACSVVLRRVA